MTDKPFQVWLHYDLELAENAPHEIWVGPGRKMMPLCGQSEFIGVTGNPEIVNCEKCLKALASRTPDSVDGDATVSGMRGPR